VRNRLFLFAALLAWCGALLAARIVRSHTVTYFFLIWNLFLAFVPPVAAMLFARARSTFARIAWFLVWLAFLPNAPYIATDFIHLRMRPPIPLWFDVALLLSCAATGILFAFTSVADVQSVIAERWGKRIAWTFALAVLVLCGFGIYLGRFLRWNSWELATEPFAKMAYLAGSAAHPMSHPRTIAVTVIYGITLALGYVAYRVGVASGQST
jgi:uncharacterized membrane protein